MDRSSAKKVLVSNVIDFLSNEVGSSSLSEETKESIEVAIQCLETAYEITSGDREENPKIDLLEYVKSKEKVSYITYSLFSVY